MGVEAPETCWATHKPSSNKLVKQLHPVDWFIWTVLQFEAGHSCAEGPVCTSEVGATYRSTLCCLHHGVRNNPLQAESVSHDGYLAVWCVSEQNKWGVLRVLGLVSERNDRNECEEKRRKPWQPSIHSSLVLDCKPFWLLCISTERSDFEALNL